MDFEKVLSELIEKGKANENHISAKEIINYYSIESEEYDNIIKKLNDNDINVSEDFKELPEDISVIGGEATKESPVIYKTESVESLNKLLSNSKQEFEVVLQDKKILGESVEYCLRIEEKGVISKLLGNSNTYYVNLRLPNTNEFKDIIYSLKKDDTKAPTLAYNGEAEIIIENGSNFEVPEVKAIDNLDENIIQ